MLMEAMRWVNCRITCVVSGRKHAYVGRAYCTTSDSALQERWIESQGPSFLEAQSASRASSSNVSAFEWLFLVRFVLVVLRQ